MSLITKKGGREEARQVGQDREDASGLNMGFHDDLADEMRRIHESGSQRTDSRYLLVEELHRFLRSNHEPHPAMWFSMAPGGPRLGTGFQLKMLMRVISNYKSLPALSRVTRS